MALIVTLLVDPAKGGLEPALVESLRNAWGGGDVVWLAPDVAAEFSVAERPKRFARIWGDLDERGVDLLIQPQEGRRKRLLLADMDSTMIEQECIDELAAEAGIGPKVAAITARAMNGEIGFEGALRERVGLLAGLPVEVIGRVLEKRITYRAGGRALIATLKANGGSAALVSGGFTAFTERVAATLGFDFHRANELLSAEGRLTGAVAEPILGREAKVETLHERCEALEIAPSDVMAVGDGANDLGMLGAAGAGIALHAKPAVAAKCNLIVNHGDLTALLYLQGYDRDSFVLE